MKKQSKIAPVKAPLALAAKAKAKPAPARGDKAIGQKAKQRSRAEKIGRYMTGM